MFKTFLRSLMIVALLVQTAVFWGETHWIFELFSHYATYYIVFGTLIGIAFLNLRHWKSALIMFVLVSINLASVGPHLPRKGTQDGNFKLLANNILYSNPNLKSAMNLIKEEEPDLVLLMETDEDHTQSFPNYPFLHQTEEMRAAGMLMASKKPATFETLYFGNRPSIHAVLKVEDVVTHVFGFHPPPPVTPAYAAELNQAFEELDYFLENIRDPVIVLGDFNTTPWSPVYKDFLEKTPLKDARIGFGIHNTWNYKHWWMPKLPIDHVLVYPGFQVTRFDARKVRGSDHRAVIAELWI